MSSSSAGSSTEMRRSRIAYGLLAILVLGVLAMLPGAGWHSAWVVDSRTQIEMIRGVSDHGLPFMTNGPVTTYPELQARWNVARGDRLWGLYPPLFAYVSYPFFRLGGLPFVSRMNVFLVLFFIAGTFLAARRFLRDPLLAVAVGYLAIMSTPVVATAMDFSAFVLAETLIVWSIYTAMLSLQSTRFSRLLAIVSGLLGGLAITAHLIVFPMVTGIAVALAQPEDDARASRFRRALPSWLEIWTPTRASMLRAGAMLLGVVVPLIPLAALNHVKFGSYNPISYGSCVWASCTETGIDQQSMGHMLRFALPALLTALATIISAWIFRRDRFALVVIGVLSIATLLSSEALTDHAWQLFKILWAYAVDVSWIYIPQFDQAPDHVGYLNGPYVIRSALQCTPILVLVPFLRVKDADARRLAVLLGLPSLMLTGACVLRANEPAAYAVGFPCVYLRYTVPALAPLLILAVGSVRVLPFRQKHAVVGVAIACLCIALLARGTDAPIWRRAFLLYGTLVTASAAVFAFWRAQTSDTQVDRARATYAVTFACALGFGVTLGGTIPAVQSMRDLDDGRVDEIASHLPARFAFVGWPIELDTPLALRATHDVQYMDFYEDRPEDGWRPFRKMIDIWTDEGRPIFALWPRETKIESPWPDVVFEEIDTKEKLFRVKKQ